MKPEITKTKLFGTDGIRGEAGRFPLDESTVYAIGAAASKQFLTALSRSPNFITGRDTRESGEWIERAFHAGAKSVGAVCESAGVITTPGVAFVTKHFSFDGGIVISASHNPYHDNGLKIFTPSGKKASGDIERAIEAEIFAHPGSEIRPISGDVSSAREHDFCEAYLDGIASHFPNLNLSGMRIVLDCANGAASTIAPDLFEHFGADVTVINCSPDGRNINENCGSLYLDSLRDKVTEIGAAIGIAFDGDADRVLFVNELGENVDGDQTLWILARLLKDHGELKSGVVVATVMSNFGFEEALQSRGINLIRANVGDKYVLEELLRSDGELGGEQSGHIIFPKRSFVGDGMMTATAVLEAMVERGKSLSELTEGFKRYPQILVNVKVREKQPFEENAAITTASQAVEGKLNGSGRLLLRYSGTENLARVMIEGKDQAEIDELAEQLAGVIRDSLGA
ncbi:MAG: phosphoglucosamine mutase [Blastocatellia bacterium]|nr:phosphoglucosamine mutase [Blastocatellia bacterium]